MWVVISWARFFASRKAARLKFDDEEISVCTPLVRSSKAFPPPCSRRRQLKIVDTHPRRRGYMVTKSQWLCIRPLMTRRVESIGSGTISQKQMHLVTLLWFCSWLPISHEV